jgi:hypothetical protein
MDEPEPTRWLDLRAVAIVASVVALVACFVAWKRAESHNRDQCLSDLEAKGVEMAKGISVEEWSTEWPFHNSVWINWIDLADGSFSDDDVRRLRRAFPGAEICHSGPGRWGRHVPGSEDDLVKLPED